MRRENEKLVCLIGQENRVKNWWRSNIFFLNLPKYYLLNLRWKWRLKNTWDLTETKVVLGVHNVFHCFTFLHPFVLFYYFSLVFIYFFFSFFVSPHLSWLFNFFFSSFPPLFFNKVQIRIQNFNKNIICYFFIQ